MTPDPADLRPTQRFSNRVAHYIRARPKYPPALLTFFQTQLGLRPSHRVADVGSGTGFLAELFLRNGNHVIGIEPNAEMRLAGEEFLRDDPKFMSISAVAEATTLPSHSVNFVVAGQAYHWFHPPEARLEFQRILIPDGWVVLVWNERKIVSPTGFDSAYDELVKAFAIDTSVDHHTAVTSDADTNLAPFFGPGGFQIATFDNFQDLDLEGVKARLASSSYMPLPDHPTFAAMMQQAEKAFAAHERNGRVRIGYDTRAYYGRIS